MRWLIILISGAITLSACGEAPAATTKPSAVQTSPAAPTAASSAAANKAAPPTAAPAPAPAAQPAATAAPATASSVDGIRVTVDGNTFDLTGEAQASRQLVNGVSILYIQKNARPSALVGGNGVELILQTLPGKEDFSTASVGIVTFTVWKGVDFSYISTGAIPGQPVKSLVLSSGSGKLSGSFESDLNGTLGKVKAKIEFGVALPK